MILKKKRCSMCKEFKPADTEHFNSDQHAVCGLHSWCKECTAIENFKQRQNQLQKKMMAGDETIKKCDCGTFFKKTKSGFALGEKDRCTRCAGKNPLIKAYVPALKKSFWVRPEGGFSGISI